MLFKKTVKKATRKFQSLSKDLKEIIAQETNTQEIISKEKAYLDKQASVSVREQEEAQYILDNVESFLGKSKPAK